MAPSSDVVILAACRATHVVVLDVLRDWSQLGLIAPVHLVDTDALRTGELFVPATVLEGGRTRPVVLQDELSARTSTGVGRVCVLSEIGAEIVGPTDQAAMALVNSVSGALPNVELQRLHVIGAALQGAQPTEALAWLGWHNVVIAPENAQGPSTGISPIVWSPSDPVRISHFVAAVCSLAGLWAAEPTGPLDGRPVPAGRMVLAARTFTRHLSAQAVESELFARLADVGQGYPVPMVDGASAWQVDDPVTASTDMAEQLLAKHPYLMPRQRQMPSTGQASPIGAREALKMLFRFLGAALRNAPRAFVERLVHELRAGAASSVQNLVFGRGGSEYEVVVNGVRPDGTPASWLEIDDMAEKMVSQLTGAQVQFAPLDLTSFWKDYVGGGLTLLDAGSRSAELPPRMSGSRRGIVTQGGRVVPNPSDVFVPPESVSAFIKHHQVAPNDVAGARALDTELADLGARQPHVAGQATSTGASLREWFGAHERTYSGRTGLRMWQGISHVRDEISKFSEALQRAEAASDIPSQIAEQQNRLATRLKIIGALAFLAVVVVVVLTLLGPPGWIFLVSSIVAIAGIWLLTSTITFMRAQRDLFALLHRRRELAAQLEILRQHLLDALEDLCRLTRAYRQYLDWSTAFGRFVSAPMGKPPAHVDDEVVLGNGFPLNHRFGAARPNESVLDETATRLRHDLFGVGWTSDAWDSFVKDVPAAMGGQAYRVREDTDILFADPGVASDSLLTTWAAAVKDREDWNGATDTLRGKVSDVMAAQGADLGPRLLAQVETRDGQGGLHNVRYTDFVNQLDQAGVGGQHQQFQRDLFSPQATSQPWQVSETVARQGATHFGRTIVVTQFSGGFPGYELRLGGQGQPDPAEPGVPQTGATSTEPDHPPLI